MQRVRVRVVGSARCKEQGARWRLGVTPHSNGRLPLEWTLPRSSVSVPVSCRLLQEPACRCEHGKHEVAGVWQCPGTMETYT
jgi:hypothetical protein